MSACAAAHGCCSNMRARKAASSYLDLGAGSLHVHLHAPQWQVGALHRHRRPAAHVLQEFTTWGFEETAPAVWNPPHSGRSVPSTAAGAPPLRSCRSPQLGLRKLPSSVRNPPHNSGLAPSIAAGAPPLTFQAENVHGGLDKHTSWLLDLLCHGGTELRRLQGSGRCLNLASQLAVGGSNCQEHAHAPGRGRLTASAQDQWTQPAWSALPRQI